MYQKSSHNNRKIKETYFPTPQTRIQQRNTQYQQNWVCLQHSNPLELICLNCQNKVLCSQCVQLPSHSSHEIKSMERAKQMICSQYQESMVRLGSKSEILDIIHVQFQANKSQINSFSKQYKEKLAKQFEELQECFQAKLEELTHSIEAFIRQYIFQMSCNMEKIRSKRKQIERIIIRYDKDRIDSVYLPELANHSYEIRKKVQDLLDDADISTYKQKLVDPEWRINNEVFQEIKMKINSINVNFRYSNKVSQMEQDRPKRKQRKDIKINQYNDRQKSENKLKNSASSNPFMSTLTPKNKSKEKKMKQKKSPDVQLLRKRKKSSAKMISMPASPAKEVESTYLATPELSRKKLFKKK